MTPKETYKIEVSKTDYYGKQFGRASSPIETLEEIEKLHGEAGVKEALYLMYKQIKEQQSYE